MRGFTVRGPSCRSDRKHARSRARQEAIELSRSECLGQAVADESRSALDGYVREGARQMLQRALECEVEAFLADHADRTDQRGRKHVVRNGYLPARTIMTGAGPLECGILCFGFARARCTGCGQAFVVAFSCKGRGVCPSSNGRHMAQTAAHLVDHVVPPVPVRQWVISVPKRLRGVVADRPRAVAVLAVTFVSEIEWLLCAAAGLPDDADSRTPAAQRHFQSLPQRRGS
jgi:hypothetical protein